MMPVHAVAGLQWLGVCLLPISVYADKETDGPPPPAASRGPNKARHEREMRARKVSAPFSKVWFNWQAATGRRGSTCASPAPPPHVRFVI